METRAEANMVKESTALQYIEFENYDQTGQLSMVSSSFKNDALVYLKTKLHYHQITE